MIKKILFVAVLLFTITSQAQIETAYQNFENSTALKGAYIGVSIVNVASGNILFQENGNQLFYPASVQKTITTAAALQLLGGDFYFETKVFYTGKIEDSKLLGNLIIESSGDPTLNSKFFTNDFLNNVLSSLAKNKITEIDGQIIIKNGEHNTLPTWLYEDIANYYGAAPQLFNYKDNFYTISFNQKADGISPTIQSTDPAVAYKFDLKLKCSSTIKGDKAFVMGAPFAKEREVIGTIPAGNAIFKVKGANAHPSESFVADLKQKIKVKGDVFESESKQLLLANKGVALLDLAKTTNYESINLFAEAILNALGKEFGKSYTAEAGIEVLENYIQQSKLNLGQIRVKDGSGLSRLNAMSPNFAAEWMCQNYQSKDFLSTLPVAGETGTMRYLNAPSIKGKIQAKSGSADGVVNYAGYITKNDGQILAFSVFVNNAYQSKTAVRREIGIFLESMF